MTITITGSSSRFPRLLLVLLFALFGAELVQANSDTPPPTCPVTVGNQDPLCASLLRTVPLGHSCDCYTFCNDELIQCGGFGETKPFQCVGKLVAGCRQEQLQAVEQAVEQQLPTTQDANDDFFGGSTTATATGHAKQECAVTVNADNALCGNFLDKTQDTTCDCYNYCNGKLIGCLAFGERTTFSCSGETVAGCLDSQRQFGAMASGAAGGRMSISMMLALVAGTMAVLLA